MVFNEQVYESQRNETYIEELKFQVHVGKNITYGIRVFILHCNCIYDSKLGQDIVSVSKIISVANHIKIN